MQHIPQSYFCSKCDTKYSLYRYYKSHVQKHERVLKPTCKHCSETNLKSSRQLFYHIVTKHYEKIPCSVPGCAASFVSKISYRAHLRKDHNDVDSKLIRKVFKSIKLLKPDHQKLKYVMNNSNN